jgi:hypothetical protein
MVNEKMKRPHNQSLKPNRTYASCIPIFSRSAV